MRQLFLVLMFFVSFLNTSNAQFTAVQKSYIPYNSVILNGGAEQGKTGWVASNGSTFSIDTSTPLSGFGTFAFDATATSETLSSAQYTVPGNLKGVDCAAVVAYKGGDANLTLSVIDGSTATLVSSVLATSSNATTKAVYFTCPTSGTFGVRLTASANAAVIYFDDVFLGRNGFAPIINEAIPSNAAISRLKIAAGTTGQVVINDGSGLLSSEAQLSGTRGGTGVSNSGTLTYGANNITLATSGITSLTIPTSGTLATLNGTEIFTGKTLTSPAINGANFNFGTATNTNRLLLPTETTTNLDALTDTSSLLAFDSTLNKVVFNAGGGWNAVYPGGAAALAISSKSTTYTVTTSDNVLIGNASSAAIQFNLFACSGNSGYQLFIQKSDTTFNAVTIDPDASETIGGSATTTLNTVGESATLVCDGTSDWKIINRKIPSVKTAFTPTGSWISGATYSGFWQRIGDSIVLEILVAATGGVTATSLTINIPSGLTIDTAKLTSMSGTEAIVGSSYVQDAGVKKYPHARVEYVSTTSIRPYYNSDATTEAFVSSSAPMTWASGDNLKLVTFPIPITGWKGN